MVCGCRGFFGDLMLCERKAWYHDFVFVGGLSGETKYAASGTSDARGRLSLPNL